jgi:hypothetical protein
VSTSAPGLPPDPRGGKGVPAFFFDFGATSFFGGISFSGTPSSAQNAHRQENYKMSRAASVQRITSVASGMRLSKAKGLAALAVAALFVVSPGCKSQTTRDLPTAGIGTTSAADTGSSIGSGFNSTPIPAGSTIWFTAVMKVQGVGAQPVHLSLNASTVTFTANSQTSTVGVPNAAITIDPAATQATTTYDTTLGQWDTMLPAQWSGNALLSAVEFPVTTDLPGGISPVTWNGTFSSDTSGVTVSWAWGAAVYTQFPTDYAAVGVKPVDDNHLSAYQSSDHAGTPENEKSYLTSGARGGGGSNWTGGLSGTASVAICAGSATQACGNCGTQTRTCDKGVWSAWSACAGEGVCAPDTTQGCGTAGTQTCGTSCQWSACVEPNPVPALTSITPSKVVVGSTGTTIAVTGTAFVPASQVQWDGAPLATTFTSATELAAAVPDVFAANPGSHSITVFTPAPGGGTSAPMTFSIVAPVPPNLTLVAPPFVPVGSGDFRLDLYGSHLVGGGQATFNGTTVAATATGSIFPDARVSVTVPAALVATAGDVTVTYTSPASAGGGTSDAVTFTVGASAGVYCVLQTMHLDPTTTECLAVATGNGGSHFQRDHRYPGTLALV